MEQKIHNTFTRMEDEIEKFDKVFAKGGKFEQAVAQTGGDIAWFGDIREALDNLANALMEGHQAAMPNMDEDVNEGRLGFSDIEKFGDEAASKIDMECRRRGSADMEPGDADELRYKVAKEMGYIKESTLTEGVLDGDDDDGFMARSQLYFLARDAIQLHGIIDDRDDLEPWVQSKISQAAQGIDAVRRYSEYNALKQEMPQDDDQELMASNTPYMDKEIDAYYKQLNLPKGGFGGKLAAEGEEITEVDKTSIDNAVRQALGGAPTKSLRPKPRPTKRIGGMPGGSTRGIDPKDNYSPEDLKRLLMQDVDENYAKDYADVLATNNDIKINRYLATIPQDVAKKLTGNRAHMYKLSDIAGVEPKRTDAPYSHATNPAYQATKAKRQKGIPMKDTIKRMHPELFDDENFDEGSYGKKKKKKYYEDVDTDAVRELVLYADNDGDLYQTSTAPVQKNLSRKWKKGVYDHDLAIKLWKYHADRAAKKYADEFGGPVMSPDVRRAAAKEFADSWKAELEAGNLHEEKESEGIKAMKKAGNAKADAEAKEKEKVDEGMEFDDKRDDDLQTVAKDLFAHAKAAAKKKAK